MSEKLVPAGRGCAEYDEKRSRFLGYVCPAETEEEARAFIAEIKKKNYDARHNCWCYIIGGGPERYSDDGEPQGTAGMPMLQVLKKAGISDAVCVVTRYFGGVLLGAGGLLRAYTKAASEALDDAGIAVVRRAVLFELKCGYAAAERMKSAVAACGGTVTGTEYTAEVLIKASVPEAKAEAFPAAIFDMSSGTVTAECCGECFGKEEIGK